MSEEKKHINFTAADIEKYHRGQLTAKEMHELEKAALDDPFLADALEGYTTIGVNATADTDELKKRLAARLEGGKIIEIGAGNKTNSPWLRVAVMIIIVAGAGLLLYQFAFNNKKENSIAKTEPKVTEEIKTADSNQTVSSTLTDTARSKATNIAREKETIASGKGQSKEVTLSNQSNGFSSIKNDSVKYYYSSPVDREVSSASVSPEAPAGLFNKKNEEKNDDALAKRKLIEKAAGIKKDVDGDGVMDKTEPQKAEGFYSNNSFAKIAPAQNQRNNYFSGRITDPNNNPLPFANVTNTRDNVGTYADAKGNFNLISPDSVLNVQIRSVGFDNNNVQLRGNTTSNQVVMQEDKSLNEVVISNKKPNANRSRDANMKLEEPEPADGWDNYDTYLSNNLNVPDEVKTKRISSGEVEVSLEVDKNGEPINIKVEKSLCAKCDKEAIRLVKEGPKWKRKTKNGRTIVTIPF